MRAVLVMDMAESVRLMRQDEGGTIALWQEISHFVEDDVLPRCGGRFIKSSGDGLWADFKTVREALAAAFEIHVSADRVNANVPQDRRVLMRVAIAYGPIVVGRHDVYGHCANVAARLVGYLAGPRETLLTVEARDQLTQDIDGDLEDLGECYVKHLEEPLRVYRIGPPGPKPVIGDRLQIGNFLPAIAVIPLQSRGGSGEERVIGDIVSDEIVRSLSQSSVIDVIARASSGALAGRGLSVAELGEALKAQFVLTGTFRLVGTEVRIDVELSEVATNRIIWNRQYKETTSAIVNCDSSVIEEISGEIVRTIQDHELGRMIGTPLPNLQSYTVLLSAVSLMNRNSVRDFQRSRELLEHVHERAPRHAITNAWIANWHVWRVQQGWSNDTRGDGQKALGYSRRSVDADPNCSLALALDGMVQTNLLHRFDVAAERYEAAIKANPNEPLAWLLRGTLHAFMGRGEPAVADTQRALRLTPLDPNRYFYDCLTATACLAAQRFEEALFFANRSLKANANKTSAIRAKLIAEWHLGDGEAARATSGRLLTLEPTLTVSKWKARTPGASEAVRSQWERALRGAGVPA